jgi:hypothetical protein
MNVTYPSCVVINGQALCVVRNSGTNGQFPIAVAECGGLKNRKIKKLIREI